LRLLSGLCVKAEPARLFVTFEVLSLRRTLEAILPTLFDVLSFLAIFGILKKIVNNLSAPRTERGALSAFYRP